MTREEAEKIAIVIGRADSACSVCVSNIVDDLNNAAFGWTFFNTGEEVREPHPEYPADMEITRGRLVVIVKDTSLATPPE